MADATESLMGRHILIVEDERILGLYFSDVLEAEGCTVVGPVSKVPDALQALSVGKFDGVILDLNLNGQRSLPVAQALVRKQIPFIIVSGYRENQTHEPALRSAPFLEKPFLAAQLIDALSAAVRKRRAHVPA